LAAIERAVQIDREYVAPVRKGRVLDRSLAQNTGAIDENVDPTKTRLRQSHDLAPFLQASHVMSLKTAADRSEAASSRSGSLISVTTHARSFLDKFTPCGLADPGCTTCHDCHLASQATGVVRLIFANH